MNSKIINSIKQFVIAVLTIVLALAVGAILVRISATGVLVVPCMLTIGMPVREFRLRLEQLLPVIALIVSVVASVVIGGAGSLSFPLPALIWCAVRYPLPVTCLLTFVTGAIEIILVANSVINIAVATPLRNTMIFATVKVRKYLPENMPATEKERNGITSTLLCLKQRS